MVWVKVAQLLDFAVIKASARENGKQFYAVLGCWRPWGKKLSGLVGLMFDDDIQ
jgi:hypothetical protein